MSAGYAEIAITSVLNSEKSFCKFLSANDTGATGAHQSGILISKTAIEMLFSRGQLEQDGIPKRTVKIKWQNDFETESCFTYYASKNELKNNKIWTRISVPAYKSDRFVVCFYKTGRRKLQWIFLGYRRGN